MCHARVWHGGQGDPGGRPGTRTLRQLWRGTEQGLRVIVSGGWVPPERWRWSPWPDEVGEAPACSCGRHSHLSVLPD